ncbi:hypothetical protein AC249_AIPGENE10838 [Exaiptasia diaphana]|nr:hypothetical protein AC249_AIPGENE10838 [Exaiptasia diaphana]
MLRRVPFMSNIEHSLVRARYTCAHIWEYPAPVAEGLQEEAVVRRTLQLGHRRVESRILSLYEFIYGIFPVETDEMLFSNIFF